MNKMNITIDNIDISIEIIIRENYKKYIFKIGIISVGSIVLEKYGEQWNLELMHVFPTNEGFGSLYIKCIKMIDEDFIPEKMTICCTSEESQKFFRKHEFLIC